MTSPFGFQVFPYAVVNGAVVKWNAVIYDLRGEKPRFLKLAPIQDSIESARQVATEMIHRL